MRIGLCLTGGTLDSVPTAQGLDSRLPSGFGDALRRLMLPDQELEEIPSPWRIDSSQLKTSLIHELGTAMLKAPPKDAWIVVAGTDTLAWLAPSLWWMLGSLRIPVLLACGMDPWWVTGSDGETTLQALPFLLEGSARPGVQIVSNGRLVPPIGVHKVSHLVQDPFRSLAHLSRTATLGNLLGQLSAPAPGAPLPPAFPSGPYLRAPSVLWLPLHPGLDPQALLAWLQIDPPRHLVLGGYSGGTLPLAVLDALSSLPSSLHLISQQWGPLELGSYAASSGLAGRLQPWNSGPETVTALLSLADAMGLAGDEVQAPLHVLEALGKA